MHNYFVRGNLRTKFFLWSTAVLIIFGLLVAMLYLPVISNGRSWRNPCRNPNSF